MTADKEARLQELLSSPYSSAEELARVHLSLMEDWAAGRRSWINHYHSSSPEESERNHAQAMCAVADAAEVTKHADAARAYAALIGTGAQGEG